MAPGDDQEEVFWDTHPWVTSEKSGSASVGGSGGNEEKSEGGKNVSDQPIADNNHSQMKQPEIGSTGGSSGGGQETVATINGGGSKRNGGALVAENGDDTTVNGRGDKGKRVVEPNESDLHIWTERERRKKMRDMFSQLHALLPQLSPKADKSTVVDEAVTHIKTLQETLKTLKKKKLERIHGLPTNNNNITSIFQPQGQINTRESFLANHAFSTSHYDMVSPQFSFPNIPSPLMAFQTWTSPYVTLNVCGLDAHFSISSPRKPGLLTKICFVLEKNKLEIVSAQISADPIKTLFFIHVHANVGDQFLDSFPYGEVYKKAATEIMLWVGSKPSS